MGCTHPDSWSANPGCISSFFGRFTGYVYALLLRRHKWPVTLNAVILANPRTCSYAPADSKFNKSSQEKNYGGGVIYKPEFPGCATGCQGAPVNAIVCPILNPSRFGVSQSNQLQFASAQCFRRTRKLDCERIHETVERSKI